MSRQEIYYWKCDRPAALYGTREPCRPHAELEQQLRDALSDYFQSDSLRLASGVGQGNHLTWNVEMDGLPLFVRVENGPECDDYLEMESALLCEVAATGVAVPYVHGCDASYSRVPFAWQALERIPFPDLNKWHKQGTLDTPHIAFEIGRHVGIWQTITPAGFGPFDLAHYRHTGELLGLHSNYAMYYRLRLTQHIDYLVAEGFLRPSQGCEINDAIDAHEELLSLDCGCLVHKDLASGISWAVKIASLRS